MRRITTGVRLNFCALSLITIVNSIYVPNVADKKTLNTLGIKTLGWQSNNEQVIVHHNYSSDQKWTTTSQVDDEPTETTTDHIKWQRINDHLTELAAQGFEIDQKYDNFEQMAQEWQTLGSNTQNKQQNTAHGALLKTINDHLDRFDQQTQDAYSQSAQDQLGFDEQKTQKLNQTGTTINDQLSGFNQQIQVDQAESKVSSMSVNDHLSGLDQEVKHQTWANLGQKRVDKVNDQLSAFKNNHNQEAQHLNQETTERINHQLSGHDQEVPHHQWLNLGTDQRQNAHESQQSLRFDQTWINLGQERVERINDHLSAFQDSHNQEIQHLDQESTEPINDQLSGYDQKVQPGQWLNLGIDQKLNAHESHQSLGFDDQHNSDDETPFVRRQITYYDGRQFTNAHGGGYQPIKSEKLVQGGPKLYYDHPVAYKECPKHATGQYAYELSCNQFLNCWKGRSYIQNCAPGTLFNPKTLECDFPEKVSCISGPRQTPFENREPLSSALQATCPTDFTGIIPHYVDCTKFINCVNGVEFAMSCAPGTLFDVKTNLCDHAYKAECANQESTSDSRFHQGFANKYIVVKPYREGGANATYHRQYLTKGGTSANQSGQNNLNINDHLNEFVRQMETYGATSKSEHGSQLVNRTTFGQGYPGFVGGTENTNQFPSQTIDSSGSNVYGRTDQFGGSSQNYPNVGQGTGLYDQFQGGTNQFGSSSNRFHQFEVSNQNHSNGAYDHRYNQVGRGTDQLESSSNQFGSNFNQFHQFGSNSHQIGQTAPSNHGQNVNLLELETQIRNLGVDSTSYCKNHPGFSVHPNNCSLFLFCETDNLMIFPCEPGSFFNPQTQACDLNYRCQQRPSHDYLSSTSKPKCPSNFVGLLPHPTICAKFLNCNNGQTFVQDCGPGTVFNPQLKVCDYPYRVRCVDQVISGDNQEYAPKLSTGTRDQLHVAGQNQNLTWNQNQNVRWQTTDQNLHGSLGAATQNQNRWWNQNKSRYNQTQLHDGEGQLGVVNPHQNTWSNQNNQWKNTGWNRANQLGARNQTHNWQTSQNQNNQWQIISTQSSSRGEPDQLGASSQTQNSWSNQNQNNQWQVTRQNQSSQWNQNQWPNQNGAHQQATRQNQSHQWNQNQWSNQNGAHQQATGQNQSSQWNRNQWVNQNGAHQQNRNQYWNQNWLGPGGKPQATSQIWNTRRTYHSPPPFPSTDTNADYVFEYDDADEVEIPEGKHKNFCQIDDFRCSENVCIPQSMVCDTRRDCPDGKDEINCEKYVEQFSVVPGTKMAFREKGKFPNVTLTLCSKYCMESKGFQCKAFNFRKNDGTCFIFDTNVGLSGGLFMLPNYDYYEYKKFTVDCSSKYKCTNQKCIDSDQVCDGINDCGDRGDEKGCKAEQLGYSVRLVGSGKPHEGVVEVSAFGRRGYICDDMFGLSDAHVLCRELGFPLGALEVHGNSYFTPETKTNETFYMMDDVSCLGNETSLRDCDFSGWGVHNCMQQEVIGVECKTPLEKCPKDYWRCETGNECLPLAFVCDAVDDCEDKSDEASQYCEAPIELRLVDGGSRLEGRVEIKYHGTWGTICDDDFNDDAAKVVCKYLGHHGSAKVKKDGYFGKGEGPIWLDQIYCQGNETAIQECLHWDWGEHNCEHNEDVGVVCSDDTDETFQIEAQRNAKLPELEALPKALFPERCGYRSDDMFLENDEVHFRVVKGSTARKGDYPWQASLRVKGKTKPIHWCGAVVMSERFVLTAAHCLDGFTKGAYIVVAGDYNVNVDEGSEQVAYIEDFYTHEQFRNGTRMNNDIALIKLKGYGFNFTKEVQPICLPDADFNQEKGMNCTISGFGSVQSGKAVASKELRAAWIPILARDVCKMPHIYGDAITDGMICAGSLDEGVDACDGDSGGPLACLHNGLFTLIGLTSWGQHCGYANKPGVYVRIAHYRDWIDVTMKKHS